MNKKIIPLIQAIDLINLLPNENLILIDSRNGKDAKENYTKNHLQNALFVDLNTQLADIKVDFALGGRHPLPERSVFAETLSNLGITKESHVIVYDDKSGANAAARFWWMLRAIGHEKVQVLDGGIQEAEKKGFPMSDKIRIPKKVESYTIDNWRLPLAELNEVEENCHNDDYIIVDVRESSRYRGESEPIDLVAGHIPGAVNVPFSTNLGEDGLFLSPTELKLKYKEVFGDKKTEHIIFHCGSGVTACHSLLAIAVAGLEIPKLYVGSWSEWSRNQKGIATES